MSKLNWQTEIDEKANTFNNEELLDACFDIAGGDDYDGCFTTRGKYQYKVYMDELYKRLNNIGFLQDGKRN